MPTMPLGCGDSARGIVSPTHLSFLRVYKAPGAVKERGSHGRIFTFTIGFGTPLRVIQGRLVKKSPLQRRAMGWVEGENRVESGDGTLQCQKKRKQGFQIFVSGWGNFPPPPVSRTFLHVSHVSPLQNVPKMLQNFVATVVGVKEPQKVSLPFLLAPGNIWCTRALNS